MIALDDNGDFPVDGSGNLTTVEAPFSAAQNAKAELRCQQGTWAADLFFGRNQLIWAIAQSTVDRAADINRICSKYVTVVQVTYNPETLTYAIRVG